LRLVGTGKFVYLLASLLVLLVIGAFFGDFGLGQFSFNLLLSVTLLTSIYAISQSRRYLIIGASLAVVTFATSWAAQITHGQYLSLFSVGIAFIYFSYLALVLLVHLFRAPSITIDELAASMSTYLLMGLSGGFVFQFIELLHPGSIVNTLAPQTTAAAIRPISESIYFSFTCLTTLGFGEIVPVSPLARAAAYLEAVVGQMFLTVLVARFVGLHIVQKHRG
jgi:hypothetical protein